MTTRTWTGMLGAAALAALLAPGGTTAQEPEYRPSGRQLGPGMVLDEDGGWRPPTPADALRALRDPSILVPGVQRLDPAEVVLQQEYGPHPAAELDALANALADRILASENPEDMTDEYRIQRDIFSTLATAARGGRFTPHPGSFDALVRPRGPGAVRRRDGPGGGTRTPERAERGRAAAARASVHIQRGSFRAGRRLRACRPRRERAPDPGCLGAAPGFPVVRGGKHRARSRVAARGEPPAGGTARQRARRRHVLPTLRIPLVSCHM